MTACIERRRPVNEPPGEAESMKHLLQKIKNYFRRFTRDTSDERIKKRHRRGVGSSEGVRPDSGQECFMGDTRERRKKRIGYSDTVRAAASRRLHTFHGVTQSAAKRNRDHDVLRRDIPRQVNDLSARCRGERIQAEQDQMILEVFGEDCGEVASHHDDAPGFIKTLRGLRKPFRVERVLEGLQILEVEFERIRDVA